MHFLHLSIVLCACSVAASDAALLRIPLAEAAPISATAVAGRWNLGRAEGSGLALEFDLGSKRVNWNNGRWSVLALAQPLDLRPHTAVRMVIDTTQPRADAEVTLWLREADGSWWHLRHCVPLVKGRNEAVVPLHFLRIAEWIAPGSHEDEDDLFDRSQVSHVALGVINPHGIGRVTCTLSALEFVPGTTPELSATAAVFARWRTINGTSTIPDGVFGGFAENLPARYRPGSQRALYATTEPRLPRVTWALVDGADVLDRSAIVEALLRPDARSASAAAHLRRTLPALATLASLEADARAQATKQIDRERQRALNAKQTPPEYSEAAKTRLIDACAVGMICERLNALINGNDLWNADDFQGVSSEPPRDPALALNSRTARVERNRALLEAVIPGSALRHRAGTKPSESFYIDCLGERKETAYLLTRPDWKTFFASWGTAFATACAREGYSGWFEFWNEPYLNWAEARSGRANLGSQLFRVDLAGDGQPVRIKRPDGSTADEDIVPHFAWRRDAKGGWEVYDSSAFTYWSGRGNGWIYDQMFAVIAPAIKAANPKVQIAAGWCFRVNEDHWAGWDMLYKPTIDRGHAWIDAITDHHYQGDPRNLIGAYEVTTGYSQAVHQRWIRTIITETNDLIDAPARGGVDTPAKVQAATEMRRCFYNLRDIVSMLEAAPDKVVARSLIHHQKSPTASALIFGLLHNLRGSLVEVETSTPDLWCVASVDGLNPNDPVNPRTPILTTVLWNDAREAISVDLRMAMPPGFAADGVAQVDGVAVDADFRIARTREPLTATAPLLIPARRIAVITQPLRALAQPQTETLAQPRAVRTQFFSPDILARITASASRAYQVALPADQLATAHRAWLRLVVEDLGNGEGHLLLNGQRIDLPATYDVDNGTTVLMIPVAPAALAAAQGRLSASCDAAHAGWRLALVSVVLEHRE